MIGKQIKIKLGQIGITVLLLGLIVPNIFPVQTYLFTAVAQAATGAPQIISYQGRLTDATGVLQNGNFDFKFSIWDSATPPGGIQRTAGTASPSAHD